MNFLEIPRSLHERIGIVLLVALMIVGLSSTARADALFVLNSPSGSVPWTLSQLDDETGQQVALIGYPGLSGDNIESRPVFFNGAQYFITGFEAGIPFFGPHRLHALQPDGTLRADMLSFTSTTVLLAPYFGTAGQGLLRLGEAGDVYVVRPDLVPPREDLIRSLPPVPVISGTIIPQLVRSAFSFDTVREEIVWEERDILQPASVKVVAMSLTTGARREELVLVQSPSLTISVLSSNVLPLLPAITTGKFGTALLGVPGATPHSLCGFAYRSTPPIAPPLLVGCAPYSATGSATHRKVVTYDNLLPFNVEDKTFHAITTNVITDEQWITTIRASGARHVSILGRKVGGVLLY